MHDELRDRTPESAICPYCGGSHVTTASFCPISGKPLKDGWWLEVSEKKVHKGGFCAECGRELPIGTVTCPYCGKEVANGTPETSSERHKTTPDLDSSAVSNFPVISLVFRAVLIFGIFVLPWFDVFPVYGVASVNLFSVGGVFSDLGMMGQSFADMTGTSSSVPAALQFAGMLFFASGVAPILVLAKEIYDILNKRAAEKIGYVATLCVVLLSALFMYACNSSVSGYLSSRMGISNQECLSLAFGWWIVLFVACAALYFDREHEQDFVDIPKPGYIPSSSTRCALEKRSCTVCHEELEDDARFCPRCGKEVSEMGLPPIKRCPRCNALVNEGYKFCRRCGKEL